MKKNKDFNTQPSLKEMKEVENLYKTNQLDLLEIKLRKLIEIHPQTSILFNIGIPNQFRLYGQLDI